MNSTRQSHLHDKIAAEQHYQTQAVAADQCGYPSALKADTLSQQLRNQLRQSSEDQVVRSRALCILEAHPEFEDLIWLLRVGII